MGVETEIRAEMARQGVTVVELAEKTGLKRPYLSLRLNGHKGLLVDHLVRIGAVLGVSPAELMRRADRTSPALADEMPAPPTAVGGGSPASPSSVERLLEHEQACDSCWSLEDAARHTAGAADETDSAVRPAALAATGQEVA